MTNRYRYLYFLGGILIGMLMEGCKVGDVPADGICEESSIGRGRPFVFMQLADPQLGFNDEGALEPDIQQLNRAIDIVNHALPPFILCTGDFVHELLCDSAASAYEACMQRLDSRIKVFNVPGNHDIHELTPEYFDFYRRHYGEDRFCFRHRRCMFIGINSTIIQMGASDIEAEQYAWLERQLRKAKRCRASFIVSHIPLAHDSMDERDDYSNFPMEMRMKYLSLFQRYGVRAMFCGHLHRTGCVDADGIEIVTASAVGNPFDQKRGLTVVKVGRESYQHQYILLDKMENALKDVNH